LRTNGSAYVAVVLAVLTGYFTYQWWFNPRRIIKRQLGELAAALSTPADNAGDIDRVARLARLRTYFAPDVNVTLGESGPVFTSRDALLGAYGSWSPPPQGVHVSFGDVQIALDSASAARAYLTVEVETRDGETGQQELDARDAMVGLAKRDGEWVVTTAAPTTMAPAPAPR
jgi:hypothetical protein